MRHPIYFYILLLMAGIVACNAPDERLVKGREWATTGQYEQADSIFSVILEEEPDHTAALNNRSYVRIQMGDNRQALQDINRAIALDDSKNLYYETRASAYLELDSLKQAEADINKALELNPKSARHIFGWEPCGCNKRNTRVRCRH